ncbi:tyrosine--tRNA ligase [Candidatus Poribacteria bacterium]|nr:tyrosine--tRNA ligase [Candidatus Poribacteria bacterium]
MPDIYEILSSRGFIQDCTDAEGFRKLTSGKSVSVYCGVDPTAPSLTIGNMVPMMGLLHFQRCGHRPIIVMGGGTGMIGDPSGKSAERNLQTADQVSANLEGQKREYGKLLRLDGPNAAVFRNNADWLGAMSFLEFLRDVGKHFRLGEMLGKDSVRTRLNSEAGISYTEFSYMLLQAYDFKWLLEHDDCEVQCGGGDQWGNITAGMELIRKTLGRTAYGITFPLLMTASGEKLGKTADGAVWLDAQRTPVFDFYQYWVRVEDRDVERFLKMFTLLELGEVADIVAGHNAAPEKRTGQKRLAFEVTRMIHGEAEAAKAREASEALYGGSLAALTDEQLTRMFPDVPSYSVPAADLEAGIAMDRLLVDSGLSPSRKEAQRLLGQGGVYLNDKVLDNPRYAVTTADLASETMLVLRAGKKRYCLVKVG